MTDVFSKEKRSEVMSKIKSKNTKLEILFRKYIWSKGLRYRLHSKKLLGRPDIVFGKKRIVVFLDGCFWHKCPKCYKEPKSNKKYWREKIKYNVEKDRKVTLELKKQNWTVIRFWEHEIKKNPEKCFNKIQRYL